MISPAMIHSSTDTSVTAATADSIGRVSSATASSGVANARPSGTSVGAPVYATEVAASSPAKMSSWPSASVSTTLLTPASTDASSTMPTTS